ncbi:aminoglycoside phosphotransferase family protein [Microbacterium sufflavum]|uniref:Aminoglycoside phosphotransferase family protein n=1 Tax=Microbacterium sufflavum TaxID=2851649 RepID=A0ABY4IB25_9MICO|nr:aminoglycoside phosphotransferase family protein [Microbacterium sufflavum]UPL09963.1 aminoglycoside phosphotransferase family protein [Microbacterium sufflavum]
MTNEDRLALPRPIRERFESGDAATREWVSAVPSVARELFQRWALRPDGEVRAGEAGLVVPVRDEEGAPAALKLQVPRAETTAAILGLTRWDGRGAVRLLDSDETRGAMLLERLDGERPLAAIDDDDEVVRVIGDLLRQLQRVPAPDGLPRLGVVAAEMIEAAPAAARVLDGDDRTRLDRWVRTVAEVQPEPGDRLLHWDLHDGNVLAADRAPWLAIDPEPLVGDPGFDLWPALDSRWSAGGAADAGRLVRRRFDILTEMLDLDRRRAAAWTRARLLQNTLWDIEDGHTAIGVPAKVVDEALASVGVGEGS